MLGFLAFASGLMAKLAPPDVEVSRLKKENAELKRERDSWRESSEYWRGVYMGMMSRADYPSPTAAQSQHAVLLQQMAMNQHQEGEIFRVDYQNLPAGLVNCVPARHDMFLPPWERL